MSIVRFLGLAELYANDTRVVDGALQADGAAQLWDTLQEEVGTAAAGDSSASGVGTRQCALVVLARAVRGTR